MIFAGAALAVTGGFSSSGFSTALKVFGLLKVGILNVGLVKPLFWFVGFTEGVEAGLVSSLAETVLIMAVRPTLVGSFRISFSTSKVLILPPEMLSKYLTSIKAMTGLPPLVRTYNLSRWTSLTICEK